MDILLTTHRTKMLKNNLASCSNQFIFPVFKRRYNCRVWRNTSNNINVLMRQKQQHWMSLIGIDFFFLRRVNIVISVPDRYFVTQISMTKRAQKCFILCTIYKKKKKLLFNAFLWHHKIDYCYVYYYYYSYSSILCIQNWKTTFSDFRNQI